MSRGESCPTSSCRVYTEGGREGEGGREESKETEGGKSIIVQCTCTCSCT